MALIAAHTGCPDFNDADRPAYYDFEQLFRAIVEQIGGTVPGKQNMLTRSQTFTDAAWTKTNVTAAQNQTDPFDVGSSATLLTDSGVNGQHRVERSVSGLVVGKAYTFSLYAKVGTFSRIRMVFGGAITIFNISTKAVISTDAGTYRNGIQGVNNSFVRFSVTAIATATSHTLAAGIVNNSDQFSYAGTGTDTIIIFGAQVRQDTGAGMYQATTTAAVDEGEYVSFPGNLEAVNFTTTPGFRNSQKAESRSVFTIHTSNGDDSQLGQVAQLAVGPMPQDCDVFHLGIVNDDPTASAITITAGSTITAWVNGVQIVTLTVPPATTINQGVGVALNLQLRIGDVLHFTYAFTMAAGSHRLRFTVYCLALHSEF